MAIKLKEIEPDMVIHCKTREEANLLGACVGHNIAHWHDAYGGNSGYRCCYPSGTWVYGNIESYRQSGFKIVEFEDLIIKDKDEEEDLISVVETVKMRMYSELAKSGGKLTDSERDAILELKAVCKEILRVDESMRLFEDMKELVELNGLQERA